MRTIVHLSDLHFGRVDPVIPVPLLAFIEAARPDVVVVSGDLTQRARSVEFAAARAFLDAVHFPKVVVPGNHDVPLHNVFSRFFGGLAKYKRYIDKELEPSYMDEEIAVIGVNTARAWTFKDGRINRGQIERLRRRLEEAGPRLKVVVTHHPLDLPAGAEGGRVVGRARLVVESVAASHVDLWLAGHFHLAHTGHTAVRYKSAGRSALLVACGTSTSTRGRGQPNSFNVLRTGGGRLEIERWDFQRATADFSRFSAEHFVHAPGGWERAGA